MERDWKETIKIPGKDQNEIRKRPERNRRGPGEWKMFGKRPEKYLKEIRKKPNRDQKGIGQEPERDREQTGKRQEKPEKDQKHQGEPRKSSYPKRQGRTHLVQVLWCMRGG